MHVDALPAEVDAHYIVTVGVLGDLGSSLSALAAESSRKDTGWFAPLRDAIHRDRAEHANDEGFPVKPQRIVWTLREALAPEDIAICDVGAHKMWMARMYRTQRPNTCIISNGFASMGIAVPGALAAKLAFPDRRIIADARARACGRHGVDHRLPRRLRGEHEAHRALAEPAVAARVTQGAAAG